MLSAVVAATLAVLAVTHPSQLSPREQDASPVALDSADLSRWLDVVVPPALREGALPGALVVVVRDGRVLVARGFGLADVATGTPMDPARTVVQVGSVSKLFTWTAVMQQVAAGRLALDRDLNADLDFSIPATFERPITLRHLMTHTAGFEERAFRTYRHPRALAEHLRGTPVPTRIFPPGEVVAYSNYGSMLAGHLVELVSGEPFVDYVDRHILIPLGMTRSSFRRPVPPELVSDLARSYGEASDPPRPLDALDHEEPAGDPSGHLATTAADMARFLLAHLQHGHLEGVDLLDSATTALMHAPAFEPVPGAHPLTLGFFRTDRNGRRIIGHAGDIAGFHADVQLLPNEQVGYFFVVNGDGRGDLLGAGHLLRTRLFRQFMDRYFPAEPVAKPPTAPTAPAHAALVAGEYQMSRRGIGDFVELEMLFARAALHLVLRANPDGTIVTPPMLDFERGQERTWREIGPFVWEEVGGTERLFMRVEDGRVEAWIPEHVFSFVLQPLPATKRALPNVVLLAVAAVILAATALAWGMVALLRRRAARPMPAPWRPIGTAAVIGLAYLLVWGAVLATGAPTREGGELWVRGAQLIGLLTLGATLLALRGLWLLGRRRIGSLATVGGLLVVGAMVETAWLSIGFHLLSWHLIY